MGKSFIHVLSEVSGQKTPRSRVHSLAGMKAGGPNRKYLQALGTAKQSHIDVIDHLNRKHVSQAANQYLLTDSKSKAGEVYHDIAHVQVTREDASYYKMQSRSLFGTLTQYFS